ncbi:hypothetical protein JMM81_06770 [Bacillus sp. V3B]|uniref:lipopolysaccharide biosynthesis protein n=1 Tax=Bacillus sp. V3B TaxID=2804915 RepID=UPI00210EE0D0|nr:hypothetical protein [Bacillus sp. V3B]MCQ6274677.1 hypothetical protein [Bacillus sp. V3B]
MQFSFRKGIFKDSLLNIIASLILTLAVQILAYPYLALKFTISEYGLILTFMGIVNAVGVSIGNSLNNTRILLQSEYDKKGINGDYNPIFLGVLLVGAFITGGLSIILLKRIDITVIGCIIITILILFRSYYSASFRIIINYKKILYSNIWGFLGYIVGIIITKYTDLWVFIFIFGELFACIYIYYSSKIVHDKFQITSLFKRSLNKFSLIMLAAVLTNIMMYMDRFYIYPFLGAEQVSMYTVASFLGKTAGIILNPIAGVLLTYYIKEGQMTIRQFCKRTGIFTLFSFFIYMIVLLIGIPITGVLYPTVINSALPYFYVANLAAILFILGNTIQPSLLRYCDAKWQLIIQSIYFLLYLVLGYFGMIHYELIGFCYAILIANLFRILLMVFVVIVTLYRVDANHKI